MLRMRAAQVNSLSAPRQTAGTVSIAGAVIAGFGAFSLWQMRVEERSAVRQTVRKRLSSVASSTAQSRDAGGDEEAYFPHERRGSGIK